MCPLYKNLSFKIEFFSPFSNLCFCIWPTLIFYIPCSNIRYSSKIVTVISISHTQTPDPSQEYKKEKISLLEGKGREALRPPQSSLIPAAPSLGPCSSCYQNVQGINGFEDPQGQEPSSLMWSCHALLFYSIRISSAFLG